MLRELPIEYAMIFFLGMLVYAPITLISSGKYKDGLKCVAVMCTCILFLAVTARLATTIYPAAKFSAAKAETTFKDSTPSETPRHPAAQVGAKRNVRASKRRHRAKQCRKLTR